MWKEQIWELIDPDGCAHNIEVHRNVGIWSFELIIWFLDNSDIFCRSGGCVDFPKLYLDHFASEKPFDLKL